MNDLHSVVFNELTKALRDEDRFVSLSERERISARIVKVVTGSDVTPDA